MKLALLLILVCSISVTLQQDQYSFWSSPYSWFDYYFSAFNPTPAVPPNIYHPAMVANGPNRVNSQKYMADLLNNVSYTQIASSKYLFLDLLKHSVIADAVW